MKSAFEPGSGYLMVKLAGEYSLPGLREAIMAIGAEAERGGHARALIDASEVHGSMPAMDRYETGVFAAERLASLDRVALLSDALQHIDGFFEDVARNRGLQVRVTRDPAEALAWITNP